MGFVVFVLIGRRVNTSGGPIRGHIIIRICNYALVAWVVFISRVCVRGRGEFAGMGLLGIIFIYIYLNYIVIGVL